MSRNNWDKNKLFTFCPLPVYILLIPLDQLFQLMGCLLVDLFCWLPFRPLVGFLCDLLCWLQLFWLVTCLEWDLVFFWPSLSVGGLLSTWPNAWVSNFSASIRCLVCLCSALLVVSCQLPVCLFSMADGWLVGCLERNEPCLGFLAMVSDFSISNRCRVCVRSALMVVFC